MSIAVMCSVSGTYFLQSAYSSDVANYEVSTVQLLLALKVSADSPAVPMAAPDLTGMSASPMFASLLSTAATGATALSISVEQTSSVNLSPAIFMLGVGSDCQVQFSFHFITVC